ncbi:SDR family oxidoreductase [Streptomyces sp. NPDC094038]|uniref:SDR family oxidoreductase n=1 Tax=Streptomyces sp. NPDC094038 TaxID=3366055 RepID=UPI0038089551
MQVLVTGAGGMLGSALLPEFRKMGHSVFASDIRGSLPRLDVRSRDEIKRAMDDVLPDMVVHLAAETSLEVCETNPGHAWETNTKAVEHIAAATAERGVPLVYVSTAGVFDGTKAEPYEESDLPHPINLYGETKLAGERVVADVCAHHFIVRAGWMVGGGDGDHKFVGMMVRKLLAGERTLHAVGDKYGSPTYAVDFSRCLGALVRTEEYGLYHMVSGGSGRRFDVAEYVVQHFGLADQVDLVEVGSDFFAEDFFAARPRSEAMVNAELERRGLNSMRPWRTALSEYLSINFGDRLGPVGGVNAAVPG